VIIPGAADAVRQSVSGRIGVIGTMGTIASNAYTNAIMQERPLAHVVAKACPLFVPLVEEGWTEHKATEMIALEYLFPLMTKKIDTLVLGCTHYPLLKPIIRDVTKGAVRLIDSGEATAAAVKEMLAEHGLLNPNTQNPNVQFFVSDAPDKFTSIGEKFLGRTLGVVKKVSIGK